MATQNPELFSGIVAGGDLRTKQFYGVKLSADRTVVISTAGAVFAVLQNAPNTDEHAALANEGSCKIKLGGVVNYGEQITTDSAGKFVKLTPSTASGGTHKDSLGTAMETGTTDDVITAMLHPAVPVHTA